MKLTPSQDLVLEVLAARYRLGENLWTFDSRHRKTLEQLAELGLVVTAGGVVEKTVRAFLTDEGIRHSISPSYTIPNPAHATLDTVREIVRKYEDWFEDCPEDGWRLQRDLMAALGMKRLGNLNG